ncbi:DUF1499 domain-containing protein [Kaistia dalseonensis]|uniref:Uncharacterized protein (DUF1499 family) n=1 Tax=Kaistia dalseonensis TaxID=410840 RepID=A0ABU0HCW8_9HYPH|nr:DUF1499 domain-containing protein [Kaistia dalseonensis]MCX5497522.1 DUF1499 domain-containing protein [Kaistia dalseonensis]MDQ0440161.1 uncharacterized protein (DUF1499 family) [Kaistia dalseonensis]
MVARPTQRAARAAPWALRFALLPLPMLILAALLRRYALMEVTPLFVVLAIAWALSILALVCGVMAFRSIWIDGTTGLRPALTGVLLAIVALALPAAIVFELVSLPRLSDLSTDGTDPPLFTAAPDTVTMRPLPDARDKTLQAEAYPDIVPRHYSLSPERVFQAIATLVEARGWVVTDQRAPDSDNEVGWIEAEAHTLGFALPVDIVLRVVEDDQGTLVDMRSASRIGAHDLGDNARRIRAFFVDLDAALQGVTETNDGTDADSDTDDPLPPLPVAPPPQP